MGKIFEDMPSLFPDQAILNKRKKSEIFNDYEGFIEKFKAKKTTDDCYTPENVYQAVLNWLNQQINISDRPIVRPFFPGFDYRKHYYPDNCIVVDNPPFSIYAQIVRFYLSKGIDFFLFAPALTQFIRTTEPVTYISVMSDIVYHNGAVVKTSFTTNLFPDIKLWAASSLYESIKKSPTACR